MAQAELTGYETGKLGVGLEQGLITGAEVYAFAQVGGYTDPGVSAGPGAGAVFYESYAEQIVGDGLVGGLANVAEGGSFQSGFLAAGFSAAGGPFMLKGPGFGVFAANLAEQTVEGGVGSVIGGGKFENGAVTGAFGYLFNRTSQLGFAGSFSFGFNIFGYRVSITAATVGFGVAIDDQLNIGGYAYSNVNYGINNSNTGVQVGDNIDAGGSYQISDAKTIYDLDGIFYNASVHAGDGAAGSVDYFTGNSSDGIVHGGGVTLGAGAGASFSITRTNTFICTISGCTDK